MRSLLHGFLGSVQAGVARGAASSGGKRERRNKRHRAIEQHVQAASGKTSEKDIVILEEAREPRRSHLAIRTRVQCFSQQLTIPMQHYLALELAKFLVSTREATKDSSSTSIWSKRLELLSVILFFS